MHQLTHFASFRVPRRLKAYTEDVLFKAWGCVTVATWYWIKVTADAELVTDMGSTHKRPFEQVSGAHLLRV